MVFFYCKQTAVIENTVFNIGIETETESRLQKKYEDILFSIPFSNVPHFFNLSGQELPLRFGADCHRQSEEIIKSIQGEYLAYYLKNDMPAGAHHAPLIETAEGYYLLDNYLLAENIIKIPDNLHDSNRFCYPVFDQPDRHSIVIIKRDQTLLWVNKFIISNGHFHQTNDNFIFDLNKKLINRPSVSECLEKGYYYNQNEKQLKLRIITRDTKRVIELVFPIDKFLIKDPNLEKIEQTEIMRNLFIRDNYEIKIFGYDNRFSEYLSKIAWQIGYSSEEILEIYFIAIENYLKYKPQNFYFTK